MADCVLSSPNQLAASLKGSSGKTTKELDASPNKPVVAVSNERSNGQYPIGAEEPLSSFSRLHGDQPLPSHVLQAPGTSMMLPKADPQQFTGSKAAL